MAILYLDSSALVKLYAAEEHSGWTIDLVNGAGIPSDVFREAEDDVERQSRILDARTENVVAVSAIAWVECCAAFAAKERVRALTEAQRVRAEEALARDLRKGSFLVRPVSGTVLRSAATLAAPYALRAYDAVQLSTALVLREETDALNEERAHDADDDAYQDEVLVLSYDRDLHSAAVETGIAHVCPGLAGGRTFPAPG